MARETIIDDIEFHWFNSDFKCNRDAHPKKAPKLPRQTNSVYDLLFIEQAITWMYDVCGYPVKSTWLKAIKARNYVG